eukprot:m.38960 g.38960  ORF g.38960 m.38960 type:complete len:337 (+) comp5540_c0_seq2:162-1172(+)
MSEEPSPPDSLQVAPTGPAPSTSPGSAPAALPAGSMSGPAITVPGPVSPAPPAASSRLSFTASLVLGSAAWLPGRVVQGPLDRIRLLRAFEQRELQYGARKKTFVGVLRAIWADFGPLGLWRGALLPASRAIPLSGLNFAFWELGRPDPRRPDSKIANDTLQRDIQSLQAGGIAGLASMAIVYPRLAAATGVYQPGSERLGRSASALIALAWKKGGASLLYKGMPLAALRSAVYRAHFFGLYDIIQARAPWAPSFASNLLAGICAHAAGTLLAHPLHVLRVRVSLGSALGQAVRDLLWKERARAIYRGWAPGLIAAPAAGIVLAVYDAARAYYLRG